MRLHIALDDDLVAERVAALRRRGIEPWTCAISVEEIWRDLRPDEEPIARRLFTGLRMAPLGLTEGTRAGAWRRAFGPSLHHRPGGPNGAREPGFVTRAWSRSRPLASSWRVSSASPTGNRSSR